MYVAIGCSAEKLMFGSFVRLTCTQVAESGASSCAGSTWLDSKNFCETRAKSSLSSHSAVCRLARSTRLARVQSRSCSIQHLGALASEAAAHSIAARLARLPSNATRLN